jgi:hypothetical protein
MNFSNFKSRMTKLMLVVFVFQSTLPSFAADPKNEASKLLRDIYNRYAQVASDPISEDQINEWVSKFETSDTSNQPGPEARGLPRLGEMEATDSLDRDETERFETKLNFLKNVNQFIKVKNLSLNDAELSNAALRSAGKEISRLMYVCDYEHPSDNTRCARLAKLISQQKTNLLLGQSSGEKIVYLFRTCLSGTITLLICGIFSCNLLNNIYFDQPEGSGDRRWERGLDRVLAKRGPLRPEAWGHFWEGYLLAGVAVVSVPIMCVIAAREFSSNFYAYRNEVMKEKRALNFANETLENIEIKPWKLTWKLKGLSGD